jgi:succinylglutamic semialdehyde dehydrogenase
MKMILKGDYFNGSFTHSAGINTKISADENIEKLCPADLSNLLWNAPVFYQNIEPVISSAIKGFEVWRKVEINQRIEVLKKFREVCFKRKSEITQAIAFETGKPLWEAETEAAALYTKVDVTISDSLQRVKNIFIPEVMPKIDGHVLYKPIGPCLVIGPFNFPCHLANGQILASLITGNSIIFKPSEKTIYSSQLLIECLHEAGFPSGVINFINGTAKTSSDLTKHPAIKGIFFTGSLAVGKRILDNTYRDLTKLVALEMGGKNSTIIHKDTNIDHALPELLRACFLTAGQRCTSTSMIIIHKSIEQEFINKFHELAKKIIVDHPSQYQVEPFMGPVIDQHAEKTYFDFCEMGLKNGATEIMKPEKLNLKFKGHYVTPSIHYLAKANKENPFTQHEIFGPNCTFTPYENIEDAIRIANISEYGLAASVFTRDPEIYKLCLRDIDTGLLNLNRSTVGASSRLPFGGVKNSGNYHPAAVSMIDHTVCQLASLETLDDTSSNVSQIKGLKN